MAITHKKLEIMNNALRMVGSYHLDADDTTSVTYEIADRAFEDAVNTVFSENIFAYNTRRIVVNGVQCSTLDEKDKPSDQWNYRYSLAEQPVESGFSNQHFHHNLILKVTDINGRQTLDWVVDNYSTADLAGDGQPGDYTNRINTPKDTPYLFTTEGPKIQVYYSFVPDLNAPSTLVDGKYTHLAQGEQAERMPAFLVRIVTLYMAQSMAIELSGSENRQGILFAQYERALRRARVLEGRSSPAQTYINDGNSQLISSHYGYGSV